MLPTLDVSKAVLGRLAAPLAVGLLLAACARRPPGDDGGELRVAVSYDVASLDPHLDNSLEGFEQVSNVYDPLVALDRELRVVPALAVSWHNPDPTTWVFRWRQGIRFHDGSPLGAEDVVHSVRRLKADDSLAIRSQVTEVASATAEDGGVVLRTRRPSARLLNDLAHVLVIRAGATRESLEARPRDRLPLLQKAVRLVEDEAWWIPLYHNQATFIVDRTLAFEPRADLYLRYAEIGKAGTPP